jgi:hypothetical protein
MRIVSAGRDAVFERCIADVLQSPSVGLLWPRFLAAWALATLHAAEATNFAVDLTLLDRKRHMHTEVVVAFFPAVG